MTVIMKLFQIIPVIVQLRTVISINTSTGVPCLVDPFLLFYLKVWKCLYFVMC